MSNLIYSVKEIFTTYLEENKSSYFNIPEYQRGYKWTKEDVSALLNDLKKFENANTDKNSFYCLQNITIVPNKNKEFDVVDGQQRLTTLYILLGYLKSEGIEELKELDFKNKLKYSIRDTTGKFLSEVITEKNFWTSEIKPEESTHRDEYYIREVALGMKEWFEEQKLSADTILNRLKLIINKINGKEEAETIFANINGSKVPLDGADLVRAVLMTRSAKEKFTESNSEKKINEFRVRMGMELDEINRWWSVEEVKSYFQQFLPNATEKDENFNQKEFHINLLYKLFFEIYKGSEKVNKFSFKFFEYGFCGNSEKAPEKANYEMYQKILSLHLTLKDWYQHHQLYHLLGYLFINLKNGISINEIWKKWESTDTKETFIMELKELIGEQLLKCYREDDEKKDVKKELLNQIKDIQYNWYDSGLLFQLLPLMDVIHFLNLPTGKLKPSYFRVANEDKEHIMCQNPQSETECITRSKEVVEQYLDSLFKEEEQNSKDLAKYEELKKLLPPEGAVSIEIQEKIEKQLHAYCLNSIGNIVLLNPSVNRSYKNALYNEKVARIIAEFFNTDCIRPFTASVFLQKDKKNINTDWHWGIKEIRENARKISEDISKFLGWEM